MIPTVAQCRFITISQIRQRIADDNFTYKSVRLAGKVKEVFENFRCLVEDPSDETQTIEVNTYLFKFKTLTVGNIYEFLGEIEEVEGGEGQVYLKGRVLKQGDGFHKMVYADTSQSIN